MPHSSSPTEKKEPLTYSVEKCCLDETMTHPATLLWHWQRSKAADETWKHNKAMKNHLESLHGDFLLLLMLIYHIREHDSALLQNLLDFFFLVKQTVWNEMKYYRRWILKLQVVIGKVKKCISKHKRTTYFVYIDMPLDTAYVKAL